MNDNITKLAEKFANDLVKGGLVNDDGTIPMAEWKNLHGDFVINNDDVSLYNRVIDVTPDYIVQFFNKDQKSVGKFDFNDDKLKFEGDLHESAEILITFLLNAFNQKIEQIKDEVSLKAYERGYKDCDDYHKVEDFLSN